ncbi:hypothetical protein CK503_04025 [Aliifodinibius salipaludis]|uniref:RAMA domain-containing protein n=1 Tax=Fodinibius salipaludis TaxID=2032627 RepID=A0A2A2GDV6_9BACT|nr:DUF4357 domain-containing protein [Aliifodinibius salipaludis]PAU95370.1 hypothetical protein CK503_04025 [Aliifodinibius salipaludis]
MLILNDKKFIKSPFDNEAELEQVIIDNYEHIFGPSSIYLPKKKIKTGDGAGTIPDGFAIDLASQKWYLVEAELLHHTVWNHIAPQVSKQVIASLQPYSKKVIQDLAVETYSSDETTKEKFQELGIKELNVRKVIQDILEKEPVIGVPIDNISSDLKEWARTLKYNVKLWVISKFVEFKNSSNVVYEFPEEFKPEVDTEKEEGVDKSGQEITRYDVSISDLIEAGLISVNEQLNMDYKPRNGEQKRYSALVHDDGSLELLGQKFSSPSYAALAGIQDAGSDRQTVNGWTSWKTKEGNLIADLREEYLQEEERN